MLAENFKPSWIKEDIALQPKMDGVRSIWDGTHFYTRNQKPIVGLPKLLEILKKQFNGFPMDGEIFAPNLDFDTIVGNTKRTVNVEENEELCFYAFDLPIENLSFKERFEKLKEKIEKENHKRICLVQTNFEKASSIKNFNIFGKSYEGTMVRNSDSEYKFSGRSTDLLKVKVMHDMEALVIDQKELMNYKKIIVPKGTPGSKRYAGGSYYKNGDAIPQNTLGALVCTLPNGKTFEIGSGFNKKQRKEFWTNSLLGKTVTFKYQELTKDGIPRFPVFLRVWEKI